VRAKLHTGADVQAKLHKAAEDFAATALNALLKPIFETTDTSEGPFGGGAGERAFQPMFIDEVAKHIAHEGGLGLVEPVFQQMLRLQQGKT
jgi:Rod binding domain-containing protein